MTAPPLDGLRVLDLSRFIAGPLCCQILGDMGAEVIKVERPGGEDSRRNVPHHRGHSLYTLNYNRSKHGITLDTRHPKALGVLEELVRGSDVVVENFRPGTLAKMGLGWERIHELDPRAVLVSISGFGQTGPNRDRALFDAIAQAASGLMSMTGTPDGPPTMAGAFVADHIAAFHGVMGAMMALAARARTGDGQHVDISCLDALFSCMGTLPAAWRMLGEEVGRTGNRDHITVPANAYPTADGYLYLHAGTDALFPRLAAAMGMPELTGDPRFADQEARLVHVEALDDVVRGFTRRHTSERIGELLAAAGVPYSPVNSVAEATDSAQVRARDMMIEVEHPELGTLVLPGLALKLGGTPGSVRKAPPLPGEDNAEVYPRLLGLDADELAALRADGVI
ncbi:MULTISPECIES: CaiB/BaiF CoA-transferase family protein [unclassified Saccharopolyspora]|uniref:CaiB/BaiF CoA transferase family protein n=1 Tax=unclassified Saccharopolyspora TaxID=2646250 RepID=UPI001CD7627C|nr:MULTISPECIES: CoA transferase [unclassified Saccharopolyspora]MCA1189646.1 CoA transferase [Saccharopolyspora sp. 6T]MCA1195851.1 CoA transferase [Saccharopolyspora sp. 6V]MCA1225422.1 CoA transferase [Saccharopolyspora sp. 6M]MCA1279433.1 CoA transferase [Saccharopolyspora sp. 7B]